MNLEQLNPLVTVYIPTFNRVELLKRAVESVRQQTYQNLEIIIVDDCSKDGTHEYLEDISKQDLRIRYFIKEKNSGACVSRNIAIKNAQGEFITGLDDDDYFLPERIQNFIDNKSNLDDFVFIYSKNLIKDSRGVRGFIFEKAMPKVIRFEDLLNINYVGNQIFIRTETLKIDGLFDEKFVAWQDLENWYGLLKKTKGYAKRIFNPTYVQDMSHDFERITTSKVSKILETYNTFVIKHELNKRDSILLKGQLIGYGVKVDYYTILLRFFFNKSFYVFMVNLKLAYRNLFNKLK